MVIRLIKAKYNIHCNVKSKIFRSIIVSYHRFHIQIMTPNEKKQLKMYYQNLDSEIIRKKKGERRDK